MVDLTKEEVLKEKLVEKEACEKQAALEKKKDKDNKKV